MIVARKTTRKKNKITEEKIIEETKELIEEVEEVKAVVEESTSEVMRNPYDAMFDDGPAPSPMDSVMNRNKKEEEPKTEYDGWWAYRDDSQKLTIYKCPETHKKIIVRDEDRNVAV